MGTKRNSAPVLGWRQKIKTSVFWEPDLYRELHDIATVKRVPLYSLIVQIVREQLHRYKVAA
ncbi:MAG TPA: hypothetical protein VFO46_02240 [Candidatus Sulfotelmatobacter sp.]|nr:hypothetical protein [Candidatus Sulfotelmatobacter sp.]